MQNDLNMNTTNKEEFFVGIKWEDYWASKKSDLASFQKVFWEDNSLELEISKMRALLYSNKITLKEYLRWIKSY